MSTCGISRPVYWYEREKRDWAMATEDVERVYQVRTTTTKSTSLVSETVRSELVSYLRHVEGRVEYIFKASCSRNVELEDRDRDIHTKYHSVFRSMMANLLFYPRTNNV